METPSSNFHSVVSSRTCDDLCAKTLSIPWFLKWRAISVWLHTKSRSSKPFLLTNDGMKSLIPFSEGIQLQGIFSKDLNVEFRSYCINIVTLATRFSALNSWYNVPFLHRIIFYCWLFAIYQWRHTIPARNLCLTKEKFLILYL